MIRQPIVTVVGHVDHGKTSILDCFRESSVQEKEAGGITQKISFTLYPLEQIKKACPLIEKNNINLEIPGFLFIDTPGHAAFTNLRKRGGSLADLAILVIDINEGIKPQTEEVIQILKSNKVPFIIALNKVDNISGWRIPDNETNMKKIIESQAMNVKQEFDEKYLTIIGSLNSHGFNADLYYKIDDFTKKIAMVPTSAKMKIGIEELLFVLCGLSQRYLKEKLKIGEGAKGVVLEIKKEKGINYCEAILYDGELSLKDTIAISKFDGEPVITKIRILEEIEPLSFKFKTKEKVRAATGIRMQLITKEEIPPGMPFEIYNGNLEEITEKFKREMKKDIKLDKEGIIAKADSLGSLEALLLLLKQNNISVVSAGIGNIKKQDIISAKASLETNELNAIVVGFNVKLEEDAKEIAKNEKIKVITHDVIYKLIEDLVEFRKEKAREIERRRLEGMPDIFKIKILHKYVFRNSNPAIFGVAVEAGKLKPNSYLIDGEGEKIGKIKNIQSENSSIDEAVEGMEVAMSVKGVNFERQLKNKNYLYSDMTKDQYKKAIENKDLLSQKEIKILEEIYNIKKNSDNSWDL